MKNVYIVSLALLCITTSCNTPAAKEKITEPVQKTAGIDSLRKELQQMAGNFKGNIGFALKHTGNGDTLTLNGAGHYPMQSVFKFPLSLAVLHACEEGKLAIDAKHKIAKADLLPGSWSPIRDDHPNGAELPLKEIMRYTVSQSDNSGCDFMFRLLGGPRYVNDHIHSLGIKDMAIVATEAEMHRDWETQFTNRSTPFAMVQVFEKFYKGNALTEANRDLLWQMLTESTTGPRRIKGQLPEGTVVGHKTGSSGTNDKGITAAVNDAGVIILPDGQALIIAVFVSNTTEKSEVCEDAIAAMSKAAWDYYTKK
ncbi:MAG: class A beta-lactamase, subclass A2 [Bacteroidia bacterium]|nr:class A beta-lactamase, subclass A2 [Bacteroidia bacterium]